MAKRKTSKASNGEGETITVTGFNPDDPQESRALAMSQLLATKHGRRKQVIVALLDAMYQHYQSTGNVMSGSEVYSRVIGNPSAAPTPQTPPAPRPASTTPPAKTKRSGTGIRVEKTTTKERSVELGAATLKNVAGWFDD